MVIEEEVNEFFLVYDNWCDEDGLVGFIIFIKCGYVEVME